MRTDFKIEQIVKVKEGTLCPDYEKLDLSGFEARVFEVYNEDGQTNIGLEWLSKSLNKLPEEYIKDSIEQELDYQTMFLDKTEIELSKNTETIEETEDSQNKLIEKYQWYLPDPEFKFIYDFFQSIEIDQNDHEKLFEIWQEKLVKELNFPFRAEVLQSEGNLELGDKVNIIKIVKISEEVGIIVKVKFNDKTFDYPLYLLEALSEESKNYLPVQAYGTWFVNK